MSLTNTHALSLSLPSLSLFPYQSHTEAPHPFSLSINICPLLYAVHLSMHDMSSPVAPLAPHVGPRPCGLIPLRENGSPATTSLHDSLITSIVAHAIASTPICFVTLTPWATL